MDWLHPTYWWALTLVLLMAGALGWAAWQRRQAVRRFGNRQLLARLANVASTRRRWVTASLTLLAGTLLVVSLAGPRYGTKVRTVERRGIDLLIALDVSKSMLAEDVPPSRLERAKQEIAQLLPRLSGDRVGLLLFAGDAFLQCPLTTDYDAVRLFLDVARPEVLSTPGTNFERAFEVAQRALAPPSTEGNEPHRPPRTKALLFVTDGENHLGSIEQIVETAQQDDITLFAAGVGTPDGARIPLHENGRRIGYKRDRQGHIVRTRLEEDGLRQLTQHGAYFQIAATSSALSDLPAAIDRLAQTVSGTERFETYSEQFQWPLALALLLLTIEPLLRTRRG